MMTRFGHISDADLTAFIDGELSARKHARVDRHLRTCSACAGRRRHFQTAILEFLDTAKPVMDSPQAPLPVAALRARLNEAAQMRPFGWRSAPLFRGLIPAVATFAFLLIAYLAVQQAYTSSTPDAALTPGVTRAANKEEICTIQNEDRFYPIPATIAYRVFETYGIRDPEPHSYEVDYLITPELGGADDIRNLWPQPYGAGKWNAHVKDALEDHLYALVCGGQVSLEKAQRDIATNWIGAYKQYFGTEEPLTAHRTFSKDPPWPHEQ